MNNNKELKKFLTQERIWLTDIRMELNKLLDKYLNRLDSLELKIAKEDQADPIQINEETVDKMEDFKY